MTYDNTPSFGYQKEMIEFGIRQKKVLLDADPGVGKTHVACKTYFGACAEEQMMVLTTRGGFAAWINQAPRWLPNVSPSDIVVIEGNAHKRKKLWAKAKNAKIILTTPTTARVDEASRFKYNISPKFVTWDECHKLRKHTSPTFKVVRKIIQEAPLSIIMTGTMLVKGPQDLFPYLNTVAPDMFKSYWKYIQNWCETIDNGFGKEIIGPKNNNIFRQVIKSYYMRIKEDDPRVKKQRPSLLRDFYYIDLDNPQRNLYNQFEKDLYAYVEAMDEYKSSPMHAANNHNLRKVLVSPMLIDRTFDWGTTIKEVEYILEEDPHTVFYTPYRDAVDLISLYIKSLNKGYEVIQFMGGLKTDDLIAQEKYFNENKSGKVVSVGTISYAQSFELWSAKRCFFLGFDYNQNENYQAEKRLHRAITPHPITSYYIRHRNTIEDDIIEILNKAQFNVNLTVKDFKNLLRLRQKEK